MKKLFFTFLFLLLAHPVFAGQLRSTLVDAVTIDDNPTSASGIVQLADVKRTTVFVDYDETDSGSAESIAVTAQVSWDGTNFFSASFYDFAGGSTLQTSETISADGRYVFWLSPDVIFPYLKVILTATGSDASHTAIVSVHAVSEQ